MMDLKTLNRVLVAVSSEDRGSTFLRNMVSTRLQNPGDQHRIFAIVGTSSRTATVIWQCVYSGPQACV